MIKHNIYFLTINPFNVYSFDINTCLNQYHLLNGLKEGKLILKQNNLYAYN